MEKRSKNQISTFLLIVGVIFIMIAGSIFVTAAWQQLSETGKRIILASAVAGLYVASWKLREKGILTKTEHALYYLAAAGTGFITVSLLGGWSTVNGYVDSIGSMGGFNNADRAMWGLFATAIGIAYRFFKERKAWDFGILSFIFINMFFLVFEANVHDMAGLIPLAGLLLLASFQYVNTGKTGYRITQSLELCLINYYFIFELYDMFSQVTSFSETADSWWYFAVLLSELILMVLLERKELIYTALSINWMLTVTQLIEGIDDWAHERNHLYDIVPYALTTALALLIMWYRSRNEKYGRLAILHGLMVALELIVFLLAQTEWYGDLGWDTLAVAGSCMCIMIAYIFGIVDCMLVNDTAKRIMKTLALVFSVFSAFFLSFIIAPDNFEVEFMSAFFGVGIVLLGRIWYDRAKGVSVAQFVLTCITLFLLLLHNIEVEELANLMVLGIGGIIMLIVAAYRNRREYVIASSATLSLLAIYLTREFWLSIAWWVYLFAAGVVLVGIAVKKEREA